MKTYFSGSTLHHELINYFHEMGIHTQNASLSCVLPFLGAFVSTCWFIRGALGEVPLEALQLFDDMKSKQLEVAPPKNRGGEGR